VALLALMVAPLAFADDPPHPRRAGEDPAANGECLACHSEAGLKKPPKEGLDLKKLRNTWSSGYLYGIRPRPDGLYKCHGDGYDEHPHAAKAKEV
jgi:hypothetical protein